MGSKRQMTRAKLDREQAVREKRARKQQKRDDKKLAGSSPEAAAEGTVIPRDVNGERPT